MVSARKFFTAFMVGLFLFSLPAASATLKWNEVDGNTIKFGKPLKGQGHSKLILGDGNAKYDGRITYVNKVNRPQCLLVFCLKADPKQHHFKVFDNGTLVSRGSVWVDLRPNPKFDIFHMKSGYLADGYKWLGKLHKRVCENCRYSVKLMGPPDEPSVPSPVPLPGAAAMLLSGLAGLVVLRRRRHV